MPLHGVDHLRLVVVAEEEQLHGAARGQGAPAPVPGPRVVDVAGVGVVHARVPAAQGGPAREGARDAVHVAEPVLLRDEGPVGEGLPGHRLPEVTPLEPDPVDGARRRPVPDPVDQPVPPLPLLVGAGDADPRARPLGGGVDDHLAAVHVPHDDVEELETDVAEHDLPLVDVVEPRDAGHLRRLHPGVPGACQVDPCPSVHGATGRARPRRPVAVQVVPVVAPVAAGRRRLGGADVRAPVPAHPPAYLGRRRPAEPAHGAAALGAGHRHEVHSVRREPHHGSLAQKRLLVGVPHPVQAARPEVGAGVGAPEAVAVRPAVVVLVGEVAQLRGAEPGEVAVELDVRVQPAQVAVARDGRVVERQDDL
mmetsp:Transcript_55206/g.155347  ORF Transcript_55206/g.155347 Transcript_55206/m.155347 type:complete len:365 (+) Transcript_55206:662-1756(+)